MTLGETPNRSATPVATPPLSVAALVMLGALVLVLVGGFLVLVLAGRDTSTYTLFVAGPLVTSAVGAILSGRVARVEQIAAVVRKQTDGQLTAQLATIHAHLDEQTSEILEAVPTAPAPAAGSAGTIPPARTPLPSQAPTWQPR